jgi:hypothetical protein
MRAGNETMLAARFCANVVVVVTSRSGVGFPARWATMRCDGIFPYASGGAYAMVCVENGVAARSYTVSVVSVS